MKALILGCSHAAGTEMFKDIRPAGDDGVQGFRHSYPVLLAQLLGYHPLNYSIPGGSNDAMFRIFTEQLDQLTDSDMVVACWTGINRTEIWHELDQRWLPLSIGHDEFYPLTSDPYALSGLFSGGKITAEKEYKEYAKQWSKFHANLAIGALNKLKNVISLNALATSRNIRVINIDSFNPVDADIPWAYPEPFCTWADRIGHARTAWGHYFLKAHEEFALILADNLNAVQSSSNCQ